MNFLIWSFEHEAWWKANAQGYTQSRSEAGRYTLDDAVQHCSEAVPDDYPEESIVPDCH